MKTKLILLICIAGLCLGAGCKSESKTEQSDNSQEELHRFNELIAEVDAERKDRIAKRKAYEAELIAQNKPVVHIGGTCKNAGTYMLTEGMTAMDLINKAGGIREIYKSQFNSSGFSLYRSDGTTMGVSTKEAHKFMLKEGDRIMLPIY